MRYPYEIILLILFFTTKVSGQFEDCSSAQILTDNSPISVDSVSGSGIDDNVEVPDNGCLQSMPIGYYSPESQSHWFTFSAATSGTFEMMITSENMEADYDYALWEGHCPSDPCAVAISCGWIGSLDTIFLPSGIADDPMASFGVPMNTEILPTITLTAGKNYFILLDNRTANGKGFDIEFNGTATMAAPIAEPGLSPIQGSSEACANASGITYSVADIPFADNYVWTAPPGAIINNNGNSTVTIDWGNTSGLVCVEVSCPIQQQVCRGVNLFEQPDISVATPPFSCGSYDLNDLIINDANNTTGTVSYFTSQADAIAHSNVLNSTLINISGTYWVKKSTGLDCFDLTNVIISVEAPDLILNTPPPICAIPSYDLTTADLLEQSGIGIINLELSYHADSLSAVAGTPEIASSLISSTGTYWIRGETATNSCFDVLPIQIVIGVSPDLAPISNITTCLLNCIDLDTIAYNELNGIPSTDLTFSFYNNMNDAQEGLSSTQLSSSIVCVDGLYWIRVENINGCYDIESIDITILFDEQADLQDTILTLSCQSGCIDLDTVVFTEINNISNLSYTYHPSLSDAQNSSNALASSIICFSGTFWMRATSPSSCYDIAQITLIELPTPSITLSGSTVVCAGDDIMLTFDFTDSAPYTAIYTNGSLIDTIITNNNPHIETITVGTNTFFTLLPVIMNGFCPANLSGSANVQVNERPDTTNFMINCSSDDAFYTVTFDITGGNSAAYQVSGNAGTLSGSSFISSNIPTGSAYSFTIEDDGVCPPLTIDNVHNCSCTSQIGEMDIDTVFVCETEAAIAVYDATNQVMGENSTLVYVLHDNTNGTLGNILATNSSASFNYAINLAYGTTYYISAVLTTTDMSSNPILDETLNPCIVVAPGTPIIFIPEPAATLMLDSDSICLGDDVNLTFNITGIGTYDIEYSDGNSTFYPLTGISNGHIETISPLQSSIFSLAGITSNLAPACSNNMDTGSSNLAVISPPAIDNLEVICSSDQATYTVSFDILNYTSDFSINGDGGSVSGNTFTSLPLINETTYYFEINNGNACPSLVITDVGSCTCATDVSVLISVTQPISCANEEDGIIEASNINGEAPFSYLWNSGQTTPQIINLSSSNYGVTMTDASGCEYSSTIFLDAPLPITGTVTTQDASCYGEDDGLIIIENTTGGAGNYQFSIDNQPPVNINEFYNLLAGIYSIDIIDENDCQATYPATINEPSLLVVELGPEQSISLGNSINIMPQTNRDSFTFYWESDDNTICNDCWNQIITPSNTDTYTINIIDNNGCEASDAIKIVVSNERQVYLPSAFSPNGDGLNDIFTVYSGDNVLQILKLQIYDRNGNLVYQDKNLFSDTETARGWNGMYNGQEAQVSVYVAVAEVLFIDGATKIFKGDLTLMR